VSDVEPSGADLVAIKKPPTRAVVGGFGLTTQAMAARRDRPVCASGITSSRPANQLIQISLPIVVSRDVLSP
jgi:hypothetical protein